MSNSRALGFSGTRNLKGSGVSGVELVTALDWKWLATFDRFVTGACIGWDSWIARALVEQFKATREHVVIVPANRSRVHEWWHDYVKYSDAITVFNMPDGTSYKDRNKEIVHRADELFFCAEYGEHNPRSRRSGTWQTVRIARSLDVPVYGIVLNSASLER